MTSGPAATRVRSASGEGVALVVTGAVVSFAAFRLMVRIGRLPEPRRWSA